MSFYTFLVYARTWPILGRLAYLGLKALGSEIPVSVTIGKGFLLHHGGVGVVIHPKTVIGNAPWLPKITVNAAAPSASVVTMRTTSAAL